MCKKCNNSECGGCNESSLASEVNALSNQVAELMDKLTEIEEDTKFLKDGHPILLIEHADDADQFDLSTGKGDGDWLGWAICDGQTHLNPNTKKNITTPNFIDRFVVQAGGTYSLDDTGGTATETLTTNQIPIHNHGVTDPGHTHNITDPGHTHAIDDPGHTHGGTGGSHTHSFTTGSAGSHTHLIPNIPQTIGSGGSGASAANSPVDYGPSDVAGAHTHTGNTDAASGGITVSAAFTGVSNNAAFIGITETDSASAGITDTDNEGGGLSHNNLPPFWAAFYIIKIY